MKLKGVVRRIRLLAWTLLALAVATTVHAGAVTKLTTNDVEDLNTDAAVDVSGNVHVVFERAGNIYYRGRTGTTWTDEELVAAGTNPAVGAGASSVPQVVFLSGGYVYFTARDGAAWTTPVTIAAGSKVDLAVDATGVSHVVYAADHYGDGYIDVLYTDNGSGTFPTSPIRVWDGWYMYWGGGSATADYVYSPVVATDPAGHYVVGFRRHHIDRASGWTDHSHSIVVYRSATDDEVASPVKGGGYPDPQNNAIATTGLGVDFIVYGSTMAMVSGAGGAGTWTESALPAGSSHTIDTSPAPALHLAFIDAAGAPEYAVDTGTGFGTPLVVGLTTSGRKPVVIAQADPFVVYEASDGADYEVWFARTTNAAPVLDAIGDKTVNEGETLSFTVHGTDGDGDTLTYGGSGLPANTTLDSNTGAFTFSPSFTQAGSYTTVTFNVSDGTDTDSETITITVNQVNAPPVLAAVGNKTVDEAATLSFTLAATDIDDDGVTFSATNLPTGATLDPSTGAFSWTPSYEQAGSHSGIVFTVTDDGTPNLSDSETITIAVSDVNRAPVLAPIGDKSIDEGATLTFMVSATDADGNGLTYGASNLPTGATFDPATRTFSWTPDYEKSGTYPGVEFTVTDDGAPNRTVSESITITVHNVNAPPVLAAIGDRSVSEGATLTFTVSATDVDPKDTLTYGTSGLPTGATFDPGTRTFSWTPTYAQAGSYPGVTFTATDDGTPAKSDSKSITITVDNVNRAPVLDAIGDRTVEEGKVLSFTVSATDEDGDALTYSASGLPAGATLDPATGAFSWTPGYDRAGSYPGLVFTVDDGTASDSESITITVDDIPTPPGFFTLLPCRILDTREADGPLGGPALAANAARTFAVVGACDIPASAKAVSVNVTAIGATTNGNLRLYPNGIPMPLVSTINYTAGMTRANNAVVPLSASGELAVYCAQASGSVQFVLDVNGYFQ